MIGDRRASIFLEASASKPTYSTYAVAFFLRPSSPPPLPVLRSRSVVSNASIWDTLRLVPKGALPEDFVKEREATPQCKSFMHVSAVPTRSLIAFY